MTVTGDTFEGRADSPFGPVDIKGKKLSEEELAKQREALQPLTKFRQFADVRDASQQGTKHGDTFTWDVVGNVVIKNA